MAEPAVAFDLTRPRTVHVVGVGGAGMSAIATVLAAMGHRVTGSDARSSSVLARLDALGVATSVGHAPAVAVAADAVAVSTAVPDDDPEVVAARAAGVPVLRRAEILAAIGATRRVVAVSGTHGKTTTTALLALILRRAGLRPSAIVGGDVAGMGGAVWDDGEWFVVEADESDATFLELGAEAVLVTNVEPDHLERWGSLAAIEDGFRRFLADATGPRVVCADDPGAARLGAEVGAVTYGTDPGATWRIVDLHLDRGRSRFGLEHGGARVADIELPAPGAHNARNAAGAVALAVALGAPVDAAGAALAEFGGVGRRFQTRGEAAGVTVVDDYAHNPGKLRAVLDGARAGGWDRVVAVFQPHRHSRTQAQGDELGAALAGADLVVVTDVYGAGEDPIPGVSGKTVVDAVLAHRPRAEVAWIPGRADLLAYLGARLRPGDLCLTLGAGDITTLGDEVLAVLEARP
ncbi:MAG TPA: UDP-N-acetylmuramate--L-alanine ligase [Acidimicrobiales bacterium]|nr:UDP-N-acetylmuramate--L-alanine ligase [Acidimicrobiales bacterium]